MEGRFYQGALQEALRRREQLRAEIAALQRKLDDVEAFISLAERVFEERGEGAHSPSGTEFHDSTTHDVSQGRTRNPDPPSRIAELAREEILALGRPMTRGELVGALEARGVKLIAKDRAKNVGTILWRFRDQFENIPGQGYWPKDHPLPGRLV